MLPPLKQYQTQGISDILAGIARDPDKPILCVGPCGSGKSRLMFELSEWALANNKRVGILTHRQLLTDQLAADFDATDSPYTILSAGYKYDADKPIKILSAPTVYSRCFRRGTVDLPDLDLLLLDEAHLQTGKGAQAIMYGAIKDGAVSDGYIFRGASVVGFTATPVALRGGLYGSLVNIGSYSLMRSEGMHQLVKVFSPNEIDVKSLKLNPAGELSEKQLDRLIRGNTKIYASVFEEYCRINPAQLPMILFAPSVAASKWYASSFCDQGIPVAHLDGELIGVPNLDLPKGARLRWVESSRENREELLAMHKDGEIKGICNRFVLREAVNMPWCYHAIMATVMTGLSTYLQVVGRLQRFWPAYDYKILQCHGGCLDDETEILTNDGWKSRTTIDDNDLVAGFDVATSQISWQPIIHRHDRPLESGEDMYEIKNDRLDIRVTGNHRLIYKRPTCDKDSKQVWPSKFKLDRIDLCESFGRSRIPISGIYEFPGVDLTDAELAFLGWWITDGCRSKGIREQVSISQKETYFNHVKSIRYCLEGVGFDWTENYSKKITTVRGGTYRMIKFLIPKGTCKSRPRNGWWRYREYLRKDLSPLLMDMTSRQFAVFLHAFHLGDGSKDRRVGSYRMLVANKTCADRLQEMAVMRGWKCNYSIRPDGHRTLSFQRASEANINAGGQQQVRIVKSASVVGERVWCVANPLETLVTRRNGKVAIIGNSYWRHGSPNEDRDWPLGATNITLGKARIDACAKGKRPEGIRCPECGGWRMRGPVCVHCGHAHEQSVRAVMMANGRLKLQHGNVFKRTLDEGQVDRLWFQTLIGASHRKAPVSSAVALLIRKTDAAGLKIDWDNLKHKPPLPTDVKWHYTVTDVYPWLKRLVRPKKAQS